MATNYPRMLDKMMRSVNTFEAGLGGMSGIQMAALGMFRAGVAEETGARAEGDAAYEYAQIEKHNYDFNAKIKEADAKTELTKGAYDARRKRRETMAFRSMQRSRYVSSGVNLRSASVITVLSEQTEFDAMDVQAILYNAEIRANTLRNAANLDKWTGSMALRKGGIQRDLAYQRGKFAREAGVISAATVLAGDKLGGGGTGGRYIPITRDMKSWRKFQ